MMAYPSLYFGDYTLEDWADRHCEDPAEIRRSQRKQAQEAEEEALEEETDEE